MTRRLLALFAPSLLAAQQTQSITCRGMGHGSYDGATALDAIQKARRGH